MKTVKPTIAAIYTRLSAKGQRHDLHTAELRSHAEVRGWQVVEFIEEFSSLKKRPVLTKLMHEARLGNVDVVLVWKLGGSAQSIEQLVKNIMQLDKYGVRFISVAQSIDTARQTPLGRPTMEFFEVLAALGRTLIGDRIRAGIELAKKRGKHCGRPPLIWRRDDAVELRAQGLSVREIASRLRRSETSIRTALKDASNLAVGSPPEVKGGRTRPDMNETYTPVRPHLSPMKDM